MKKKGTRAYEEWLDEAMKLFRKFVHDQELKRRREHKTLEIRYYWDAKNNFNRLMDEINCFEIAVRKRLKQIEAHWHNLTAFYFIDGAPSTNNPLENYYSSSLKTHRKKQLGVPGIEDQINLSRLKRLGIYGRPRKTLLEAFFKFIPFIDWKWRLVIISDFRIKQIANAIYNLANFLRWYYRIDSLLIKFLALE